MKVIYPGPSAAVRVAGHRAERGEPIDLPDGLARKLLAQGWTEPAADKPPAKKKAAKAEAETEPSHDGEESTSS